MTMSRTVRKPLVAAAPKGLENVKGARRSPASGIIVHGKLH